MAIYNKLLLIFTFFFLYSCSSSYEKLNNANFSPPDSFSKHLFDMYKEKANFEAEKMHDWNSAKLYSEKALEAAKGGKIEPENIHYWKIPKENKNQIKLAYDNLMSIYESALIHDPYNLANAISSLDCWSEQQEENWQTWDINNCKDSFLESMHKIYKNLAKNEKGERENSKEKSYENDNEIESNATLVTEDINSNILQIIYFDFDKSELSSISKKEIKKFLEKYENVISKFLIVGHTDTKGTKEYNYKLSIERAEVIKNLLIDLGIKEQNIKILGKGEIDLNIKTNDEVPHPANRRAEISPIN
jgi:OOP family OmpA-OmpF porin